MKKIRLVNLGGTIMSSRDPETGYLKSGTLSAEELIDQSGLKDLNLDIEIQNFRSIPSPNMKVKDIQDLVDLCKDLVSQNGLDGIVITHGTDTLEETAYMLNILVDAKIPIVITGSQRSVMDLGFDGSSNIRDSIIVASSDESKGKGVLVCFNQEIIPAAQVKKSNSTGLRGFISSDSGPIGVVYGQEARYYYDIKQKEIIDLDQDMSPRVYLYRMALDYPIELLQFAIDSKANGVVIEGFGVGGTTPDAQDIVEAMLASNIPVVLTTRCDTGGVRPVYDTKGAAKQLEDMGVVLESEVSGVKARLKLIAMLASKDKDRLRENWYKY